jgi:hypothetical protein
VDRIGPDALRPVGRALLPLALTKSANYGWLYAMVRVSPTIEKSVAKLEGQVIGGEGKVRKAAAGSRKTVDGCLVLWDGSWGLFDLPPGVYALKLTAPDNEGKVVSSTSEKFLHGDGTPGR